MDNLITAAGRSSARLVVLDNVYMLGRPQGKPLDEDSPVRPCSRKGEVRTRVAERMWEAHRRGDRNVMVRVLGTVVDPDTEATVRAGGAVIPGADADISTEVIPALTLSYFFNKSLALELFCCFAKHEVDGEGSIRNLREIADTWIFPPALTLQYHFSGMGAWKPYVGAGIQYINFFDTGTGDNLLGATKVSIDDASGFTLQAGIDLSLGNGWYLNADVKKTWLDTDITWHNSAAIGGLDVVGDADLDPWIFSAGVAYRFNLADIFGHRAEAGPIK